MLGSHSPPAPSSSASGDTRAAKPICSRPIFTICARKSSRTPNAHATCSPSPALAIYSHSRSRRTRRTRRPTRISVGTTQPCVATPRTSAKDAHLNLHRPSSGAPQHPWPRVSPPCGQRLERRSRNLFSFEPAQVRLDFRSLSPRVYSPGNRRLRLLDQRLAVPLRVLRQNQQRLPARLAIHAPRQAQPPAGTGLSGLGQPGDGPRRARSEERRVGKEC